MNGETSAKTWLVLVFQFPKGAGSQRVRIWRRLQGIGAIAIKSSVYVLPANEQCQEDFEWLLTELAAAGAEATLLESKLITGLDDAQLRELFIEARNKDYVALEEDIENIRVGIADDTNVTPEALQTMRQAHRRARKRMADIEAIDFFGANGQETAQAALWALEERLAAHESPESEGNLVKQQPEVNDL
ncbi:MAG: Chromate resistance protein ChrB, partial [Xanthomonadales bacterium]|nr:Chromate resistance protein ChrB [Xanthomonadales bacterium]